MTDSTHTKPDIVTELQLITPKAAHDLLGLNTHNRNPKKSAINAYARDMASGRWRFTGETIVVSDDGRLLDGQNRLQAVVKSAHPQWFLVVYGVSAASQKNMDAGVKRSFSDTLRLQVPPVDDATNVAALTRLIAMSGNDDARARLDRGSAITSATNPTQDELWDTFSKHEQEIISAVRRGRRIYGKLRGTSSSNYTFATFTFDAIDPELCDTFWELVLDGGGSSDSPTQLLRAAILRWNTMRDKPTPYVQLGMIFKAWNQWMDGEQRKLLKFTPAIEALPVPHGPVN